MRPQRLVRLAVPRRTRWQVCTTRRIEYGRALPIAVRAPAQRCELIQDLVERRRRKINELQFKDRPIAGRRKSYCNPSDRSLSKGRIDNAPGVARRQPFCKPKYASLRVLNILAKDNCAGYAFERFAEDDVQCPCHSARGFAKHKRKLHALDICGPDQVIASSRRVGLRFNLGCTER